MPTFQEAVHNIQNSTPPIVKKESENFRPGQTFSPKRLAEACAKYGVDPCEVAAMGLDPTLAPDLKFKERADIALKMMEYLMPKKRATESKVKGDFTVVLQSSDADL